MAHARNIDQRFLELKNFWFKKIKEPSKIKNEKLKKQKRGLFCEFLVAYQYLKKDYQLLGHRIKISFVEVDLLFKDKKGNYLAIEVKSLNSKQFFYSVLQKKQAERLKKAIICFQNLINTSCRLHLATVNLKDEIEIYEDILSYF